MNLSAIWLFATCFAVATATADGVMAQRLEEQSRTVWSESFPGFGGFSAIEVYNGGRAFLAVTDRGDWATATIERIAGRIERIRIDRFGSLLSIGGEPLTGREADAEGLAIDAQGRAYVSFEAFHRIRRYDVIGGPASEIPSHPDFPLLQNNSGLEALAIDGMGRLHAIPERSGALDRPFPVYRLTGETWEKLPGLPRMPPYLVAGADFGPDGKLYILERDFRWLGGFSTRIRRFEPTGRGFDSGVTLLETPMGELDNMEGISVWRDAKGDTRLTLISDDNFFPLQTTLVVEYMLTE